MRYNDTIHHTTGIGHHIDRAGEHLRCGKVHCWATELYAGEGLVLNDLETFRISSVASSALQRNDDPVEAVERAKRLGHELVFIYGLGASIVAGGPRAPEPYIRVTIGMTVRFQGNFYTIEKAPNHNLRLQPVPAVSEVA